MVSGLSEVKSVWLPGGSFGLVGRAVGLGFRVHWIAILLSAWRVAHRPYCGRSLADQADV